MSSNQKRVFVLLGPPGTGKGTQAEFLRDTYNLYHIDTGRSLRQEIADNSDIGKEAKSYMDQGLLVPIEVVLKVIHSAMTKIKPEQQGYLFDGFPRNKEQAEGFEAILKQLNLSIDRVLYFNMPHEDLMDRLVYRVSCADCDAKFNTKLNPPEIAAANCETCHGKPNLVTRSDDKAEVVGKRLEQYNDETAPLVSHFKQMGNLIELDARPSIESVKKTMLSLVNEAFTATSV